MTTVLTLGKEVIGFLCHQLDSYRKKFRKTGTKIASDLENTTQEKRIGPTPVRTCCTCYSYPQILRFQVHEISLKQNVGVSQPKY
jgi:hypothetical protein